MLPSGAAERYSAAEKSKWDSKLDPSPNPWYNCRLFTSDGTAWPSPIGSSEMSHQAPAEISRFEKKNNLSFFLRLLFCDNFRSIWHIYTVASPDDTDDVSVIGQTLCPFRIFAEYFSWLWSPWRGKSTIFFWQMILTCHSIAKRDNERNRQGEKPRLL